MCKVERQKTNEERHPALTPVWSLSTLGLAASFILTSEVKKYFGFYSSLFVGFVLFLVGVALLSNHYVRYLHLGGCQKVFMAFDDLKVEKKEVCIRDLDKTVNEEGLSSLWNTEIQLKKKELKILLTGVTGYVGRAVLYQILREISKCPRDGADKVKHQVYVMIRAKARKNQSAADRVAALKQEDMFEEYRDLWDEVVMPAESGDLQEENCGMSEESLELLTRANINVIVHCAADVNFNRPVKDSAGINISPSLQLMGLAKRWDSCKRFVHVSTAFVNPECGTPENPMPEKLYSLGKYDAEELYKSMLGDLELAMKAKKELKFQNNYVFTKCVGEHMMVKQKFMDLKIVRPAIVGPAWMLPEESWNGLKPSTISAFMLLWGTRVVRFGDLSRGPMPVIPVDVVANGIVHAMIVPDSTEPQSDGSKCSIRNLIWSHDSPNKFINYRQMCKDCLSIGILKQLFTGVESAVSLLLIDTVYYFPFLFRFFHTVFNLGPLYLLEGVVFVLKKMGFKKLAELPVAKLLKFSDMLTLYQPFMARTFYFDGSVHIPDSMDVMRYIGMTIKATHNFWDSLFPGTIEEYNMLELIPQGRWDFWWIIIQARNTFLDCVYNFLAVKVLRALYGSVHVRLSTIGPTCQKMLDVCAGFSRDHHMVVLAPTFKSELDYALAHHVAFYLPILGLDVPQVFDSADFEDSSLSYKLSQIKKSYEQNATIVAMLQDKPSEDGRFQPSSIKHLRRLQDSIGEIGSHEYTVVPITIDYDQIPEFHQDIKRPKSVADMFSLYWSVCVLKKAEKLGAVSVSFGTPLTLKPETELKSFAQQLRRNQVSISVTTQYHNVVTAEQHLGIKGDTLKTALQQLNVLVVETPKQGGSVGQFKMDQKYDSPAEKWFSHFQWMPRFAPYLCESHPRWATWIGSGDPGKKSAPSTSEIDEVLAVLRNVFDEADALAARAEGSLREKNTDNASVPDLVAEMKLLGSEKSEIISPSVAHAAALFVVEGRSAGHQFNDDDDEKKNEA